MKRFALMPGLFLLLIVLPASAQDPVDYVNVFVGTRGAANIPGLYGGQIPGVTRPFGNVQWTPMTRLNAIGVCPYEYDDKKLIGFIGTRQPTVWMGDYGAVSLMPGQGELKFRYDQRGVFYSHLDEKATPYLYSVKAGGVKTTLAATALASIFRFEFQGKGQPWLVIDASRDLGFFGGINIDRPRRRVTGYNPDRQSYLLGPQLPNFRGWFVIEFDADLVGSGIYMGNSLIENLPSATFDRLGGYVRFAEGVKTVHARIGTSLISLEQAEANLQAEIPDWDLDRIARAGRDEWNEQLGRITVKGSERDQKILYSSLYHVHLYPRRFDEHGRYYSAFDDRIHEGVSYNDYSLWDTFRALHPLLILTAPERVGPMVQSLLQIYREGGWLPKWPNPAYTNIMIGTHADSVIADAYVKGLRDFDLQLAWEAVRKDAFTPPDGDEFKRWGDRVPWTSYEARHGLYWYLKLGYVPVDKSAEATSSTLEYAYDDFCVAQIAKAVGADADYETLMAHSKNYRNLWKDGYFQGRRADGSWAGAQGYTESIKWGYMFFAPHDVPGLIELMGGPKNFERKLDGMFAPGLWLYRYIHSNEPVHGVTYLYNYIGKPWKTQREARKMAALFYGPGPYGILGNDDCGQMAAWYVFTSLGFYPVTPGTDVYALGSPIWREAEVKIGAPYAPATFKVIAKNQSKLNVYIRSARLNGKELHEPFLRHADIIGGGTLELEMSPVPNPSWWR